MSEQQAADYRDNRSSLLLLIGPFLGFWGFFWLVPLLGSLNQSLEVSPQYLSQLEETTKISSFLNFERALNDSKFVHSLENTFFFVSGTVFLTSCLGFFLASILFGLSKFARRICLFILLIPSLALPGTLATLFYLFFHGKSGALNQFLIIPFGFDPINWMMDPNWILPCLILQAVWRWAGLITLLIYCGLCAIPKWQFEVAQLEGASSWHRIRSIFYPGVKHLLFFGGIFLFVDGVAAFSGAYSLLGGSGGVLDAGLLFVTYAYQVAFPGGAGRFDLPLAYAMCLLVAAFTVLISWFFIFFRNQQSSKVC